MNEIDPIIINSEGTMEESIKKVYKAMANTKKTPTRFDFFLTSEFLQKLFVTNLALYLVQKKAKKVKHVQVNIYVEQKEG